jgi:hypothetical protein
MSQDEDVCFPFTLVRTIGNYIGARHALVLHWREYTEELPIKKPMRLLYTPPRLVIHPESLALLDAIQTDELGNKAIKRQLSSSHGGLRICACLTEFVTQQLKSDGATPTSTDPVPGEDDKHFRSNEKPFSSVNSARTKRDETNDG